MTLSRVFTGEITRKASARPCTFRFFFVDSKPKIALKSAKTHTYVCKKIDDWRTLFAESAGNSMWVCDKTEKADMLLKAASHVVWHRSPSHLSDLGDLVLFESPKAESLPPLQSLFRKVIGQVPTYRMLPANELTEVLISEAEETRDLFIGGSIDPTSETLTLTRGNLDTIVVAISMFRPSGTHVPEWDKFAVADYGNTIRFGAYEAAADAILFEADPDFRKRQNAKRRQHDKGFGSSLRRLRIQRHLSRHDFPTLTAKTIARLERGETGKPHGKTLRIIAATLGVAPGDIETY